MQITNYYRKYSQLDYIRNNFYKFPKWLDYLNISPTAKITYMYLLNRYELSIKNEWIDTEGNIYCYFSRDSLASKMQVSEKTITRSLKILEEENLLINKQQGLGKPNRIYILYPTDEYLQNILDQYNNNLVKDEFENYVEDDKKGEKDPTNVEIFKKGQNVLSGKDKITFQEGTKCPPSKTNINNTNINNSFILSEEDKKENFENDEGKNEEKNKIKELFIKIKNQIDYDYLITKNMKSIVDEYVLIIADTLTSKDGFLRIKGQEKNIEIIKSQFWKLDSEKVQEAINRMENNSNKIHDVTSYIRSLLFDVSLSISNKYVNQANLDMAISPPRGRGYYERE